MGCWKSDQRQKTRKTKKKKSRKKLNSFDYFAGFKAAVKVQDGRENAIIYDSRKSNGIRSLSEFRLSAYRAKKSFCLKFFYFYFFFRGNGKNETMEFRELISSLFSLSLSLKLLVVKEKSQHFPFFFFFLVGWLLIKSVRVKNNKKYKIFKTLLIGRK